VKDYEHLVAPNPFVAKIWKFSFTRFKMCGRAEKDVDMEKRLGNYWQLIKPCKGYPWGQ
jgi:hypothetical protein